MANKDNKISQLDRLDLEIIRLVAQDGRMAVTEIARRVGSSKSPCQVRLKRLQEEGYILGFKAILNLKKLGNEHVAFAEVTLSNTREKALNEFNHAVQQVSEIEQCHMIAGRFDYLLKIRTRNITTYRAVLGSVISSLPHVQSTSTSIVMESVKEY